MKAREGDLLETRDHIVFDVKGLLHPPTRVVAFPRFIPDARGNRSRGEKAYRKVYALSERYDFLESQLPSYLVFDPIFGERLCEVPGKDVIRHYTPTARLQEMRDEGELDELETAALSFLELLQKHAGIAWDKLGISGSLLARIHTVESDIDPIVYGVKNSLKLCEALKALRRDEESLVKVYTRSGLRALYRFRQQDTKVPFDDFAVTESRKILQGTFLGRDFYIRCVKDWDELEESYGDRVYKRVGRARIRARISSDLDAIFTPCRYSVDNVRALKGKLGEAVSEIASFRGRFCEQAMRGETVTAEGKVEEVRDKDEPSYFRLLLGGKTTDFMIVEK